jgi:hypothetical protein
VTQTLDHPPAVEHHQPAERSDDETPAAPELLIKEARRRQRRRWLLGTLVAAAIATLVSGLVMSVVSPPPRTPAPRPSVSPAPGSDGSGNTRPGPPVSHSGSPRLVNIAFFNPTSGYGVFTAGWTQACRVEVATTSDGGADFQPPVDVAPCSVGVSALAFDDHGDGFLYGATSDHLYVTHDGGSTWSAHRERGNILSVEALGYSIWMLVAECPEPGPSTGHPCQFAVRQSEDGGRTWRTSPSQPRSSPPFPLDPGGSGGLVRVSQTAAYVVGSPERPGSGRPSRVPLWYTGDSGTTWTAHVLPCGIGATGASMLAASTGTLYATCFGRGRLGDQDRSTVVSTDGGSSWSFFGACQQAELQPGGCSSGLTPGFVRQIVAVSSSAAVIYGERWAISGTTEAGGGWRTIPRSFSTSISNVIFFNRSDGIALASPAPEEELSVLHTTDGGTLWTFEAPVIQKS